MDILPERKLIKPWVRICKIHYWNPQHFCWHEDFRTQIAKVAWNTAIYSLHCKKFLQYNLGQTDQHGVLHHWLCLQCTSAYDQSKTICSSCRLSWRYSRALPGLPAPGKSKRHWCVSNCFHCPQWLQQQNSWCLPQAPGDWKSHKTGNC